MIPFGNNTVQNVMDPGTSCNSEAAITPPSEPHREVVLSTTAALV